VRKRPVVAFVLAVLAVIGVGVGMLAATGEAALRTTSGGTCPPSSSFERLVVQRVIGLPQNHPKFSFTTPIVVTEQVAVRDAAFLLCGLPLMPSGPISCPADFGTSYIFRFYAARSDKVQLRTVLDPDGCRTVTGLGRTRWAAQAAPSFWRDLGNAIGLHDATNQTFSGTLAGSNA